jgi:hypothetical protein
MYKKAKTMRDLRNDKRVSQVFDEGVDGIWVHLKDGFINNRLECGTIHEYTIADCCQQLNEEVTPIQ